MLINAAWERKSGSKVQSLSDSQRTDEGILLLDIGADPTESFGVRGGTVDIDIGFDVSTQNRMPVSEHIQQGRFSGTTIFISTELRDSRGWLIHTKAP